jgi:hypothetical protein
VTEIICKAFPLGRAFLFTLDIVVVTHLIDVTYPPNPLSVKGALVAALL